MGLIINSKTPRVQERLGFLFERAQEKFKVQFRPEEKLEVSFQTLERGTRAQVFPYPKDGYYVIHLDRYSRGMERDFSFLHEMVHALQFKSGQLKMELIVGKNNTWDYRYIWEDARSFTYTETCEMGVDDYLSLPWESEANMKAAEIMRQKA